MSPVAASDAVFVRALLARDREAWREFHHRHDRLIRRSIARALRRAPGWVGAEDQREIHCVVLVQLLAEDMRRLRAFDPTRSALGTWIVHISMNCARDHLRALRSRPRCVAVDPDLRASEGPTPLDAALSRERAENVARALGALSARDREFCSLYWVEGEEPRRIAQRMGLDLATVYSKRHKIQRRLESLFALERAAA